MKGMNFYVLVFAFFLIKVQAQDVYVKGYTKKDGTIVDGHFRTAPNLDFYDNYSTRGNINPYTLEPGWKTEKEIYNYSYYFFRKTESNVDKLFIAYEKKDVKKFNKLLRKVHLPNLEKQLLEAIFFIKLERFDEATHLFQKIKNEGKTVYDLDIEFYFDVIASLKKDIAYQELVDLGLNNLISYTKYSQKEIEVIERKFKSVKNRDNFELVNYLLYSFYLANEDYEKAELAFEKAFNLSRLDFKTIILPKVKVFNELSLIGKNDFLIEDLVNVHLHFTGDTVRVYDQSILKDLLFEKIDTSDFPTSVQRESYDHRNGRKSNLIILYVLDTIGKEIKLLKSILLVEDKDDYDAFISNLDQYDFKTSVGSIIDSRATREFWIESNPECRLVDLGFNEQLNRYFLYIATIELIE